MKILITGYESFIGKNLYANLVHDSTNQISTLDSLEDFDVLYDDFDVMYHLLSEYRSDDPSKFNKVHVELTKEILRYLDGKKTRIILVSSEQVGNGTPYGDSRATEEELIKSFSMSNGNSYGILRLANEFGKWCKPNYNSVVATFCYQIARDEPVRIDRSDAPLCLEYIDDIISILMQMGKDSTSKYYDVFPKYSITVGELAKVIPKFKSDRDNANISEIDDELVKKLYSTYLTYLPERSFGIRLNEHDDDRGSFTELLHFNGKGQVSINISKPGITKGNHWHNTKTEKFLVVAGEARISFRKVGEEKVIDYFVSGNQPESIDIPPGYTHNITNIGTCDLVVVMWANEVFDPEKPDTYFMEV